MNDPMMQVPFYTPSRDKAPCQGHTAGTLHGDVNLCLFGFFPPDVDGPSFPGSVCPQQGLKGPEKQEHDWAWSVCLSIHPPTYLPPHSFTLLLFKCPQCCQNKPDSGPAHIKCLVTQSKQTIKAAVPQALLEAPPALASRKSGWQFAFSWRQAKSWHLAERAG